MKDYTGQQLTREQMLEMIAQLQYEVYCHETLDESTHESVIATVNYLDSAIGSEICTVRSLLTCGGVHPHTEKQVKDALTRMSGILTDAVATATDPDALD